MSEGVQATFTLFVPGKVQTMFYITFKTTKGNKSRDTIFAISRLSLRRGSQKVHDGLCNFAPIVAKSRLSQKQVKKRL